MKYMKHVGTLNLARTCRKLSILVLECIKQRLCLIMTAFWHFPGDLLTNSSIIFKVLCVIFRHFEGKNIVLTSVRPLKANEIVPENYGPVFTRKTLAERQRSLSSRYWFDCKCLACEQDWPCLNQGLENVSKRIKYVSLLELCICKCNLFGIFQVSHR